MQNLGKNSKCLSLSAKKVVWKRFLHTRRHIYLFHPFFLAISSQIYFWYLFKSSPGKSLSFLYLSIYSLPHSRSLSILVSENLRREKIKNQKKYEKKQSINYILGYKISMLPTVNWDWRKCKKFWSGTFFLIECPNIQLSIWVHWVQK